MQYRKFGKLDWNASVLGFGCMRLPTTDGLPSSPNIIEFEAVRMVRRAIDAGVNYIDTAYPYHAMKSEGVVGKALKDGYREKVKLATKCPVWLIKKPEDFDAYLAEQLARLDMPKIDLYLMHGLTLDRWQSTVLKHNLLEKAEAAVADGRLGHVGFSFHDSYDAFVKIVDGYDKWSFCQIQYNYLDVKKQAGTAGLKYAHSKGLPVVIMEPLLGGKLANPPQKIMEMYHQEGVASAPADLALRWLWNQPEVTVVLSGMGAMQQVEQNIATASAAKAQSMPAKELEFIGRLQERYAKLIPIGCTRCNYCMPCPNGVDIPENLGLYNDGVVHEDMKRQSFVYMRFFKEQARAGACLQCKECEKKCPQKIPISDWMGKIHSALYEKPAQQPKA